MVSVLILRIDRSTGAVYSMDSHISAHVGRLEGIQVINMDTTEHQSGVVT